MSMPIGASLGNTSKPSTLSSRSISEAPHSMPCDSTPRSLPFLILKSFKNDAQRATTYNFRGVILELIESAYDNTYNLYMVDDLCKYKIYVDTSEGVIRKFKPKKPEDINIIEDINTTEIIEESKEEKQNHDNR